MSGDGREPSKVPSSSPSSSFQQQGESIPLLNIADAEADQKRHNMLGVKAASSVGGRPTATPYGPAAGPQPTVAHSATQPTAYTTSSPPPLPASSISRRTPPTPPARLLSRGGRSLDVSPQQPSGDPSGPSPLYPPSSMSSMSRPMRRAESCGNYSEYPHPPPPSASNYSESPQPSASTLPQGGAASPPIPPIFHINSTQMTATSTTTARRTSTTSPVFQLGPNISSPLSPSPPELTIFPPAEMLTSPTSSVNSNGLTSNSRARSRMLLQRQIAAADADDASTAANDSPTDCCTSDRVGTNDQRISASPSSAVPQASSTASPLASRPSPTYFTRRLPLTRSLTLPEPDDRAPLLLKLSNAAARMGGEGGILEEDEEMAAATGADRIRSGSLGDNLGGPVVIVPTFTVTINPMEDDEMTYVPPSPPDHLSPAKHKNRCKDADVANGNDVVKTSIDRMDSDEQQNGVFLNQNSIDLRDRSSSIGSASSLQMDNRELNQNCLLSVPADVAGNLGVRRVSDISHLNELRDQIPGIDSEYYEVSRVSDPDALSIDSIHKTVFKRCEHKYIPPQRSSAQNKCFVVVTSGFTVLGIIYGFWYKNFGPGKDELH